jgi:hypothetical protein
MIDSSVGPSAARLVPSKEDLFLSVDPIGSTPLDYVLGKKHNSLFKQAGAKAQPCP